MKKNRTRLILLGASALLTFGTMSAFANTQESSVTKAYAAEEGFETLESNWYRIKANATKSVRDDDGTLHRGESNLEIYLSPDYNDYKSVTRESISALANRQTGLIGAAKYLLSNQIDFKSFVTDVEEERIVDETKDSAIENRNEILDGYVKSAFGITEGGAINASDISIFESSMEMTWEQIEEEINNKEIPSGPKFIRYNLAVMLGNKIEGSDEEKLAKLAEVVGVSVDTEGNVVSVNVDGGLGLSLQLIYSSATKSINPTVDEKIEEYVRTIFEDAKHVLFDKVVPQSLAVAETFVLLQDTDIPTETIIEILNDNDGDMIKDAIIDCVQNEEVPVATVQYFLEEFTEETMADICDSIGLTSQDIIDLSQEISVDRLMEITDGLSTEAWANLINLVFGSEEKPEEPEKEEDEEETPTKAMPRVAINFGAGGYGSTAMNNILARISIRQLINAVKGVWISDPTESNIVPEEDQYLIYSNDYNGELGHRFYLENIINWFNDCFPKMSEIRNLPNEEMKKTIHFEVLTPLYPDKLYFNITLGFMPEKNSYLIRKVASFLDETFDINKLALETNEETGNRQLSIAAAYRPKYLTNLYSYVLKSDIIKNTPENRTKAEIFEWMYMPFGELQEKFENITLEELLEDLRNIDFEEAIDSFLQAENFNEIFEGITVKQEHYDLLVHYIAGVANREHYFTFDNLCKVIDKVLGEGRSNIIKGTVIETLVDRLNALLNMVKDRHITMDYLLGLSNDRIYEFIEGKLINHPYATEKILALLKIAIKLIPDELNEYRIMDFYTDERTIDFGPVTFNIPWDRLFNRLPYGDEIRAILSDLFRDNDVFDFLNFEFVIDLDAHLQEEKFATDQLFAVNFKGEYNDESVDIKGLLPVGANVADFAPTELGGKKILYWVIEGTEERVDVMPSEDVVLVPQFPKVLDFSKVKWNKPLSFEYDGEAHTVTINEETLPEGPIFGEDYTIEYTDNEKVEVGSYTAFATVNLINTEYFELGGGDIPACSWTINPGPLPVYNDFESEEVDSNQKPLIKVYLEKGFNFVPRLNAVENMDAFEGVDVNEIYGEKAELALSYELKFYDGQFGLDIDDSGKIKVLLPEELIDKKIILLSEDEEGNVITPEFEIEDGYAVFATTVFTKVGIIKAVDAVNSVKDNPLALIITIVGLVNIALVCTYLFKKENDDQDIENDEYVEDVKKMKKAKKAAKELKDINF